MNCQERQLQITLHSYDELSGDERAELEGHVRECSVCADAMAQQRDLHGMLAEDDADSELPADLLVQSRRSLADALDQMESRRRWWHLPEFSVVFRPMKMLESAALVAMGLACGVFIAHQRAANTPIVSAHPPGVSSQIPENATVTLRSVRSSPSGMLEVAGEVVQPIRLQGTMKDVALRQILLGALQDSSNPGPRLSTVEILAQQPFDQGVKEGLIYALTQDPVAGVRMKALDSLKMLSDDAEVRTALVQALRNDNVPGIRAGAIEALTTQHSQDDAVVQAIEQTARDDDNDYVRMIATRFVGMRK